MKYGAYHLMSMLSMVAHELRNPLAAIQAALRVLQADDLSAERFRQVCAVIDRQVWRLAYVTQDLLDAAHCATGKLVIRKKRVDLGSIIIDAVEACRSTMEARHHGVIVQLPAEPVEIVADPIRMMQVLTNVLDNSAKYSESHRKIGIVLERNPDEAVVRIADQGIGISAELLPHIFDLFVQGDDARVRARGGRGLGLSLVKRIVELHGGTVNMISTGLGHGSTFTMRIPAQ